jgi:hypothetical protein
VQGLQGPHQIGAVRGIAVRAAEIKLKLLH